MAEYDVRIYDSESGCDQPMRCKARNVTEARRIGNEYIRKWNLVGGTITDIKEVEDGRQKIIAGTDRGNGDRNQRVPAGA